ncbi:hypothetical protein HDU79_009518 [Rhizoclosmatium sp. JEL0117]|nr:hypothetical protein HDU79_009518 [Rhizoclosmatium sp. JEL0117]
MASSSSLLSWDQLRAFCDPEPDKVNGPANVQSYLRLFGQPESSVEVTFYRDLFFWCPYCEKVTLFLEEKRIPYRVRKVTMFCYGEKEAWYKKLEPSGMLPALSLGDELLTESDEILVALEAKYGPLEFGMTDSTVIPLRKLERRLFSAWCQWLCYPSSSKADEDRRAAAFASIAQQVEGALSLIPGPYFLPTFSIADVVFIPYVERMRASFEWFDALWSREVYRGLASDFFTHVHDLPPQMGGCYVSANGDGSRERELVNRGPWNAVPQFTPQETLDEWKKEALRRCVRHKDAIVAVNADTDKARFDAAFRFVLGGLVGHQGGTPPAGSALGLRHLRNQISIPRDMSVGAGVVMRQALEDAAALDSDLQPPALPVKHRRDQDARPFQKL